MLVGARHGGNSLVSDRDQMLGEVYDELRAAAARMLRRDAPALTLQPTELVNEAALRIVRLDRMTFKDRQHFFATSARIMRQAMMDAVRSRRRAKRQTPAIVFENDEPFGSRGSSVDVELLDSALTRLEQTAPELARIVELRFFVGLGLEEIAEALGLSHTTVKRRWKTARLWLLAEIGDGDS